MSGVRPLMQKFSFGGEERERVQVLVYGYERAPVGDYYDDNWLSVEVQINAGAFTGSFQATFLTEELTSFLEELRVLHSTLRGKASFTTMEGQLSLELEGNGMGHINLLGKTSDQPGIGNQLQFQLSLDQTQLQDSLQSLEALVKKYPVRHQ
jgi:hypothetical protein